MELQPIKVGQIPNDGKGDTFRDAALKMNANFQALDVQGKEHAQRLAEVEQKAAAGVTAGQTAQQAAEAAQQAAAEAAQQAAQGDATHANAADPHPQYVQGAASLGNALALFVGRVAGMLRFRSLKAGTGIKITAGADELLIEATGGNVGTVTSVNGISPNASGEVTVTPFAVGALGVNNTAVDSSRLAGKLPSHYATAAAVEGVSQGLASLTTEVGKKAPVPAGAGPWWMKAGVWVAASLGDLAGTLGRTRLDGTAVPRVAAFSKPCSAPFDYPNMLVKTADGNLLGWGETTYGALGVGLTSGIVGPSRPIWTPEVPPGVTVTEFVHCRRTAYAVLSNGWVYSAGEQGSGELGQGDTTPRRFMTRIDWFAIRGIPIKKVFASTGRQSYGVGVFFLDAAGNVYSCGNNQNGHLGDGTALNKTLPTQVPGVTGIVDVSLNCSQVGIAFLRNAAGELWATGHSYYGTTALGLPYGSPQVMTFTKVPGFSGVSKVVVCGDYNSNSSAYGDASFALVNGELYSAGWNGYGISGLGPSTTGARSTFTKIPGLSGVVDFGAFGGYYGTAWAVTDAGRLYVWGHNGQGVMGIGSTNSVDNPTPTQPVGYASESTGYAPVTTGDPPFVGGIVKVEGARTAFGHQHMVLLDTSNRLWFIGHDYCQFVGLPTYITRWTQIPPPRWVTPGEKITDFRLYGIDGEYRLFILTDDQNLYVIGSNAYAAATAGVNRTLPVINSIQKVFP